MEKEAKQERRLWGQMKGKVQSEDIFKEFPIAVGYNIEYVP